MSIDPPRSCGLASKAGVHMYASGIMNSLTRAFKSYQNSENFTGNTEKNPGLDLNLFRITYRTKFIFGLKSNFSKDYLHLIFRK